MISNDLIIFVRHNNNWSTMDEKIFYSQKNNLIWGPNDGEFPHEVKELQDYNFLSIWNDTFDTNWFRYRYELKELANFYNEKTLCKIIYGMKDLIEELTNENDCYFLPVDDDDFFRNNIKSISSYNSDIVLWKETSIINNSIKEKNPKTIATNSYAIKKSFIKNSVPKEEQIPILYSHARAAKIIFPNKNFEEIKQDKKTIWMNESLSATIRHIGSITQLTRIIGLPNPKNKLLEIRNNFLTSQEKYDVEYEWCKDYLKEIRKIYKKLIKNKLLI